VVREDTNHGEANVPNTCGVFTDIVPRTFAVDEITNDGENNKPNIPFSSSIPLNPKNHGSLLPCGFFRKSY